jgi:nucleotide-binding universal stress UspA family protein
MTRACVPTGVRTPEPAAASAPASPSWGDAPRAAASTFAAMEPRDAASRPPILAAFDAASAAREPVEFGIAASALTGAPLIVVAVHPGGPLVRWFGGDVDDAVGDSGRAIEHLRLDLQRRGVEGDVRVIEARTAAQGLEQAMRELEPELVVVGATRRSAAGATLIGTTAERVVHVSRCPVALVPLGYVRPEGGVQIIGAAFTPTEEGIEALDAAARLARAAGVRLRAITVLDPKGAERSAGMLAEQHREVGREDVTGAQGRLEAERRLREAAAEKAQGLDVDVDVLTQEPAEGLIAASGHVDMLVMGSRGRGPKRAVLLGSVSRQVMAGSHCPALIIPRGAAQAAGALVGDVESRAGG